MAGEPVWTHQLPRVGREAQKVLLTWFPWLAEVMEESKAITEENYKTISDEWVDRYGARASVPRMSIDQHERIDPFSELAEKVHPDKIISISAKDVRNPCGNNGE
jgi:hypothetical protein